MGSPDAGLAGVASGHASAPQGTENGYRYLCDRLATVVPSPEGRRSVSPATTRISHSLEVGGAGHFSEDALITAPPSGPRANSCYSTAKRKQAGLTQLAEPYEYNKVGRKPSTAARAYPMVDVCSGWIR